MFKYLWDVHDKYKAEGAVSSSNDNCFHWHKPRPLMTGKVKRVNKANVSHAFGVNATLLHHCRGTLEQNSNSERRVARRPTQSTATRPGRSRSTRFPLCECVMSEKNNNQTGITMNVYFDYFIHLLIKSPCGCSVSCSLGGGAWGRNTLQRSVCGRMKRT